MVVFSSFITGLVLIQVAYLSHSQEVTHSNRLYNIHLEQTLDSTNTPPPNFAQSPNGAGEYYANKRLTQNQTQLPSENYVNAIRNKRAYFENQNLLGAEPWENLGPEYVGGRTRSIIFHPTTPDIMYAAGVSGGVWKSTNAGNL